MKEGKCAPVEGDVLDYKEQVDIADSIGVAEICKDVVAFHNRFGGYLVLGVQELAAELFIVKGIDRPLDVELLKNKIRDFTGERIGVTQSILPVVTATALDVQIAIIYIPQRRSGARLVHFRKDGPGKGPKGSLVFRAEDVFYRESDESRRATAVKVFEIGAVSQHPLLRAAGAPFAKPLARIANNLPDRAVICPEVVGRRDALNELWQWLSDDLSHVKVLAGEGGIGKSTIAYEFADQVTLLCPNPFAHVIWLSAKARQFRPFRDAFEDMPETHFSSYEELVNVLCDHLAITPEERNKPTSEKLRLLKHSLNLLTSLVVIDDIDSLSEQEQRQALEIGFFLGGTQSKLLLTTRKNISYSSDICYEIRGLNFSEFEVFFERLRKRLLPTSHKAPKESEVKQIWEVSHGSPLYAESILRLLNFHTVKEAIRKWEYESGDAVRKAALQLEISQLRPEGKRILLALARLGEASPSEIADVAEYSRDKVREGLSDISSLFLIDAPSLGPEARIRLNDTTCRLVIAIEADLVTDVSRIDRQVKELRSAANKLAGKGNSTVAAGIRQAATLERQGDISAALGTLAEAVRRVGKAKSADLLAYVGHLHLRSDPPNPDLAREACREAYRAGSRKKRLFEAWFSAEWDASNFVGAGEVARAAIDNQQFPEYEWRVRLAAALAAKAHDQAEGTLSVNVLDTYFEASGELSLSLRRRPETDRFRFRPHLESINDAIWSILRNSASSAGDFYTSAHRFADLIDGGDTRIKNFTRLIDLIRSGARLENRKSASLKGPLSAESLIARLMNLYLTHLDPNSADGRYADLLEAVEALRRDVNQPQAA